MSGVSEKIHRIFKKHGIPSFHKPFNTLRALLVNPKDKTSKEKKCGVVYSVECRQCGDEYVGETGRALGCRFKEHTDGKHPSSAITEHTTNTGHRFKLEDVRILQREDRAVPRKIREAIEIHKRNPSMNRDRGQEIPPSLLQLVTSHDRRGHVTTF